MKKIKGFEERPEVHFPGCKIQSENKKKMSRKDIKQLTMINYPLPDFPEISDFESILKARCLLKMTLKDGVLRLTLKHGIFM